MEYKIKELMSVNRGASPRPIINFLTQSGYRWLKISDFKMYDRYVYDTKEYIIEEGLKKTRYIKKGTLILTNSATPGIPIFLGNDMCLHDGFLYFQNINETIINIKYLYYWLLFNRNRIVSQANGSVFQNLKKEIVENFVINVPDMKSQARIVQILESLNNKIELNNKINDNLLKLNTQLYEEYFINNIDEKTNEVYLKDLIKVVNGYSYKGSELVNKSDIGLATIKNFERKGGFKEDGFKPLNPQKIKEEQIVENNDILVACTDLTQQADIIGNAVLLLGKAEYEKIIISMDLVKIIPNENIDKYIIFSILNSREFKNFALGYKSGTTVLHLNKKCFDDFIIKLPNNNKLDVFSEMIKNNYEKISNIIEENRRLEKLRDTLLPKLMNGEIDLDKIEI